MMFRLRKSFATMAVMLLAGCVLTTSCSQLQAEPLRALIVDGQSNHVDWELKTRELTAMLQQDGLFTVDNARTPAAGQPMDAFAPDFSKYDVVVISYNGAAWPEATRNAFTEYVRGGGGVVFIHESDNAFPDWKEYNQMIGLGGWEGRNENSGPYVYLVDGEWVRDNSPGRGGHHGRPTPFVINVRAADHPIMKGLPEKWMHTRDELYCLMRGPAENMTILGSGFSDPATGGSNREEPLLLALSFGEGRIFHTMLGHDSTARACVGFIETLRRSAQWAATGEVTLPVPEDFPTAEESRSRDLEALMAAATATAEPAGE